MAFHLHPTFQERESHKDLYWDHFVFLCTQLHLKKIIENYGVDLMIYADDMQVYAVLTEGNRNAVIDNLEHCLLNINEWSIQNYLKINSDKTEVKYMYIKVQRS